MEMGRGMSREIRRGKDGDAEKGRRRWKIRIEI
jgi:hypothetical protein